MNTITFDMAVHFSYRIYILIVYKLHISILYGTCCFSWYGGFISGGTGGRVRGTPDLGCDPFSTSKYPGETQQVESLSNIYIYIYKITLTTETVQYMALSCIRYEATIKHILSNKMMIKFSLKYSHHRNAKKVNNEYMNK